MNKARTLVEMGEFYASTVLTEAKKNFPPDDTFATPGKKTTDVVIPKNLKKPKSFDNRGPLSNENGKSLVKPLEKADAKGKKTFSGVEKFSESPEKKEVETINNFMNKSIFDRLYEDVMSDNINSPEDIDAHDAQALDLPGTEEHDGDEVTITLSKELAGKLHDALMAVLGSDEEQHAEEEGGGEEEGEEDAEEHVDGCKCDWCKEHAHDAKSKEEYEGNAKFEATELEELPAGAHEHLRTIKPYSNEVKDSWSTKNVDGQGGEGELKDNVDAKGKSEGHALVGAGVKNGKPTSPKGTANYVASLQSGERTKKNVGKVAFTK